MLEVIFEWKNKIRIRPSNQTEVTEQGIKMHSKVTNNKDQKSTSVS